LRAHPLFHAMPKLTFLVTGQSFEVPAGTSFLAFCQEHDAPHDFGCTVGSCGTCRLVIESGAENVNPQSADELETVEMSTDVKGARLGCQLKILGDIAVRPVD
jgi:ferredoxin